MRRLMLAALAVAAITTSTARAQTDMGQIPFYPWCGVTWDSNGEHRSCGFVSYAQCMDYAHGLGGMCFENVWGASRPSPAPAEEKPRRRR